jgi:glycosyltransferase involved in cell wall biosynthesis
VGPRNLSRIRETVGRGLSRLRVLHIDSGRKWRGGQRQVLLLAEGLKRRGHTPLILAAADSPLLERSGASGIEAHPIVMRTDWDFRAARTVRSVIQESEIDVVHAHDARAHAIARMSLIGLDRPPLVVTRRVPFIPKAARLKYGNRVTRFIAVSVAVADAMVAGGVEKKRILVVHSGVEDPPPGLIPRDWRRELGWPDDTVICGVVGAMTAEKGVTQLADVCATLSPGARNRTRILLLGGVRAGVISIGGVEAFSAGFMDDIIPAVAGLDVLWHPALAEGLGTAVIDGMAVGVPPVAFAVGGISEVVENETNGVLVPPGDIDAFARAAERLIEDAALRARMAVAARERAGMFSAMAMTLQTEAVYYQLLSGSEKHSSPGILRATPV